MRGKGAEGKAGGAVRADGADGRGVATGLGRRGIGGVLRARRIGRSSHSRAGVGTLSNSSGHWPQHDLGLFPGRKALHRFTAPVRGGRRPGQDARRGCRQGRGIGGRAAHPSSANARTGPRRGGGLAVRQKRGGAVWRKSAGAQAGGVSSAVSPCCSQAMASARRSNRRRRTRSARRRACMRATDSPVTSAMRLAVRGASLSMS